MFIKSLSLKNIRSYESCNLDFTDGSTVLSGDIGSGKSTILMALEFSLFGILRGKVSPTELLRHGDFDGFVSLSCEINGRDIFIKRSLKRTSNGVIQTPGTLIIDGVSDELTPTDLKARILNLLGYPPSLIAKSTNLFRYTVYTPQEQVKAILFESTENRKDLIRNIFSIDSYKRVAENVSLYSADIRERISFMKGSVDDVKTLQDQADAQKRELDMLSLKFPEKEDLFNKAHALVVKKQTELDALDKQRLERMSKEREVDLFEEKINGMKKLITSLENQKISFAKQYGTFEIKKVEFDSSKKDKFKSALEIIREKRKQLHSRFGMLSVKRDQANKLIEEVSSLTFCPTCRQDVSEDHKHKIKLDQQAILVSVEKSENDLKELQAALNTKENTILEKQELYLNQEKEFLLYKTKLVEKERMVVEIKQLEEQITLNKDKLKSISEKLLVSKSSLDKLPVVDVSKINSQLESLRKDERSKELEMNEFKTKIAIARQQLLTLNNSVAKKKEIEKQINILSSLKTWNSELFIPLVKLIEKRVMLKVYSEFNLYFQKWFDMLLEDETISVKLDEDFNPLIEQNGFDTALINLSGGEKTSVALAYRLALNKVLNDYFGTIHTKDLLILDEPTDGFSSEQLDKLREVLDDLGVKQLIIVSHEAKLDSLAKQHIRIEKVEQISRVIS